MPRKKTPIAYKPKNLNLVEMGYTQSESDVGFWIFNSIHFSRVTGKREEWVPLHCGTMRSIVGNSFVDVRNKLVGDGLLAVDRRYLPGGHSMGYRVGPKLEGCGWEEWRGRGMVYLNRFTRWKRLEQGDHDLGPLGEHLKKWTRLARINPSGLDETLGGLEAEKRKCAIGQIHWINQGVLKHKFDDYGRFHSNFTRLCREIRVGHLMIGGEPLIEIDIVGSQTLFLGLLLQRAGEFHFSCSIHSDPSRYDERSHERLLKYSPAHSPHPHLSPPYSLLPSYDASFFGDFIGSCSAGRVYEDFLCTFDLPSREAAKVAFFEAVYGGRLSKFRRLYPRSAKVLGRLIRRHGYEWVSRQMQWDESDIVLRKAVERLRCDHPEVPVLTCHDSLLTTREHLETVYETLKGAFAGLTIQPILKVKVKEEESMDAPERTSPIPYSPITSDEIELWNLL